MRPIKLCVLALLAAATLPAVAVAADDRPI
jgi:hypothetical protein